MICRHCKAELKHKFLDLGFAPPSNAYLHRDQLMAHEITLPLRIRVCDNCWLVQTEDYADASMLFNGEYAYFSSASRGWLDHARTYARKVIQSLALDDKSFVIEVASNDGYLLRNFVDAGIPCLGVEPTDSTAAAAELLGIPVVREFFGADTARTIVADRRQAQLICGNNVYAHVPDINDFTNGLRIALAQGGTINLEFPHLLRLIMHNQFDTVYHEHFSYLSLIAVAKVFAACGLRIFDVEELSTHGGSLRIYGCHDDDPRPTASNVNDMIEREKAFGLTKVETYTSFQSRADKVKNDFLRFLLDCEAGRKTVACYGAAAKGNTLMNYAGVKTDLIACVFDRAPSKQGKLMPGSHLPILPVERISEIKPDYLVILPWNIAEEVVGQEGPLVSRWGCRFVVAVPGLQVLQP
ncbi:class I SAM-dependent methyltransferase [Mesorhizobium sp. B1-1-8]|uniref:class I SAM-dependent methyltransferase n=1 Tax=Mesorhizobium sp. B1-1-8 TaxID=2589976 RepID=UPI00112C2E23|nr:class I SAM-dependent methyltransferase [Mesorhizobium sp. B1-1-8]UCI06844.1 class I SAM-dependent methyltransferase [Mesorhizobium sp. B1-1-8]